MLKIDESLKEGYYNTLVEIARENPNQFWSERELHEQVKKIIYKARQTLHGTRKPLEKKFGLVE